MLSKTTQSSSHAPHNKICPHQLQMSTNPTWICGLQVLLPRLRSRRRHSCRLQAYVEVMLVVDFSLFEDDEPASLHLRAREGLAFVCVLFMLIVIHVVITNRRLTH